MSFRLCNFCVLFLLTVSLSAQLDKRIDFQSRGNSLGDVLMELADSASLKLSMSTGSLPMDKKIRITFGNISIEKILQFLSQEYGFDYFRHKDYLIIREFRIPHPYLSVRGVVVDESSGELLAGATIYDSRYRKGVITNSYGFFSITLPDTLLDLEIAYVGYETRKIRLTKQSAAYVKIPLQQKEYRIDEVIINARDKTSFFNIAQMNLTEISHATLNDMPGMMGESDIMKGIHYLPGITPFGDGISSFYVRGGNRDQNLIIIDDAPLYNPAHLYGFYSSFVSDIVRDVQIYKGDMPAQFGGRLSSVIDIKTREGNLYRHQGSLTLNPYASRISLEGPIIKERVSYLASYRQSNFDWFFRNSNPNMTVRFYDLNLKVNAIINESNRIYLSAYKGNDVSKSTFNETDRYGMDWGNYTASLRWNRLYNKKLFSNTTVYFSNYDYQLIFSEEKPLIWGSYIMNFGARTDFTYYLMPENTIKAGISYTKHYFNPGNLIRSYIETYTQPTVPFKKADEFAPYISNKLTINNKLSVRAGIRIPIWQNIGPTKEYRYNELEVLDTLDHAEKERYNTFIAFEPRISLKYELGRNSVARVSYSRNTQFLQLLSNSISPFTTMDVWYPSGPNVSPQKSNLFALGFMQDFPNFDMELTGEIFYKKMYDQLEYVDHANLILNPFLENQITSGNAESYGFEVMARKQKGKLHGWVNYTYSRVLMDIPGINFDQEYPANWDRPHSFNVFASYRLNRFCNLSLNWLYASGSVFTSPSSFYYYNGYLVPFYKERNNSRMPDYHRLDIAAVFNLNPGDSRWNHNISLSVYNVYNRQNPYLITYNKMKDEKGNYVIPADHNNTYERIVTNKYLMGVVPSISYKICF